MSTSDRISPIMTTAHQHPLEKILEQRIVIIDGAMGTTIRTYGMGEAEIRGERFQGFEERPQEQRRSVFAHPGRR